ncbi:hypothetical protein [Priestia aryabhattai]
MKDEEILKKLHEFSDYLDVGNILSYLLRKLGWACIQILSFLVDGLEGITDSVLGVKAFLIRPKFKTFYEDSTLFICVTGFFLSVYWLHVDYSEESQS